MRTLPHNVTRLTGDSEVTGDSLLLITGLNLMEAVLECDGSTLTPLKYGETLFTLSFECDQTIFLALGVVYGGQKINGHSLYYFNPPHELVKLYEIANKQNEYKNASQY